tara:strand:- start:860 stop:1159 length:300 start_codon:yes stop_codon:yes gene_type:complete
MKVILIWLNIMKINKFVKFYFNSGNIWIKPNKQKTAPKKILVVGFISGILSKSSNSFLLCLTPKIIKIKPSIIIAKPTSQGKIMSIFRLFIFIIPVYFF